MIFKKSKSSRNASRLSQIRPAYYSSTNTAKGVKPTLAISSGLAWLKRLTGLVLLVLAIAAVVIYGISLDPAHPKLVASSATYHSPQEYLNFIAGQLNSPLDHSKLTFASNQLSNSIKINFPEVSRATVELPLFSRQPIVRLDISPPAIALLNSSGRSMLVSAEGRVVGAAASFKKDSGVIQITDQSGVSEKIGDQVFSPQQIYFLRAVVAQIQASGLKGSFTLPAAANEVDLHVTGQGYYVKLDMGGDAAEQAGSFLATKHYFASHHIQPSQYLDVRVTGKVFYK